MFRGEGLGRESIDEKYEIAEDAGLSKHLLNRVRDYARRLREGELARIWFSVRASQLPHIEKREIARFFAKLADLLRQLQV